MDTTGRKIRVLLTSACRMATSRPCDISPRPCGMRVWRSFICAMSFIGDVIKTASEEDVDVIGLQYFGAGLMYEVPTLMNMLKENKMNDIKVVLGGTITPDEKKTLKEMGVAEVFLPSQGRVIDIPDVIKGLVG